MNSATLKTLREACGLSVSDLAGLIKSPKKGGTVQERTIRYWEKGKNPVPEDVSVFIQGLDNTLTLLTNDLLAEVQDNVTMYRFRNTEDFWAAFPEMTGLPVTCHAALINRIRLRLKPNQVLIEWFQD